MMLQRLLTDFHPTRVLCAGPPATAIAAALRERGVQVQLLEQQEATPEELPRFEVSICLGLDISSADMAMAEQKVTALCQHSDSVLFSTLPETDAARDHDTLPASYFVTVFARCGFYRDVDYDASWAGPGALCLRRFAGSYLPILASYERMLGQREREVAAQRLLVLEYHDLLLQRDQEVEALHHEVALGTFGPEINALRLRVAPVGTTRERYLQRALDGLRALGRVALNGMTPNEQLAHQALHRRASRS